MSNVHLLLLLASGPLALANGEGIPAIGVFSGTPCTADERWTFTNEIDPEQRLSLAGLTENRISSIVAFAEALALRQKSYTDGMSTLTEYFISRSLFSSQLPHIAFKGFAAVLKRPVSPEILPAQLAALSCLEQIDRRFPSIGIPDFLDAQIPALIQASRLHPTHLAIIQRTAFRRAQSLTRNKRSSEGKILALSRLLPAESVERHLIEASIALKSLRYSIALVELKKALRFTRWPDYLSSERNETNLTFARALYSIGEYDAATTAFRTIEKSSNLLANALSDLSWAQLQNEKPNDAIGTALSLRTGNMRHTFAPEAPMVMAMALSELCQFPESLKSIAQFRRDYGPSFVWLDEWSKARKPLYPALVDFLLVSRQPNSISKIPIRVGTEFLKSTVFISHQEELNLLIDERTASVEMAKQGSGEQRILAIEVMNRARELKRLIPDARKGLEEEDPLPEKVRLQLNQFRNLINRYLRIRQAAGPWKSILAHHRQEELLRKARLQTSIEQDLVRRAEKMRAQLAEITENDEFIEIEILNGASQDLVWKNAHPEFRGVAEPQKSSGQTLDWGKSAAWAESENAEIWEDELGSFKTDLFNNCTSKDKYLTVRLGEKRHE